MSRSLSSEAVPSRSRSPLQEASVYMHPGIWCWRCFRRCPVVIRRAPVPPRAAEHVLKTETRSLYPGHVDWLVPPPVMEATPGTRWEKWELTTDEDNEDDEEIFLKRAKNWQPRADDVLIWYDRQNHRELCVYESYVIPAGCCQVDVFGCPAPDVKYYATGQSKRRSQPSRWMYQSRAPCQQDKDRRASTPTRDDLPLLTAPPSFVPFAPLSPAPSSTMPDSGVESTFEGSEGRLDPDQTNVLGAPDMKQTADQAHVDDLQSSDDR